MCATDCEWQAAHDVGSGGSADRRHRRPPRWASAGHRLGRAPIGGRARAREISTRRRWSEILRGFGGGAVDDAVDDDDDIKTHLTTRRARSPRVFFRHCPAATQKLTSTPARTMVPIYYVCSRRVRPVAVSVLRRAATAATTTSARPKKINPSRALRVPPPPSTRAAYYNIIL